MALADEADGNLPRLQGWEDGQSKLFLLDSQCAALPSTASPVHCLARSLPRAWNRVRPPTGQPCPTTCQRDQPTQQQIGGELGKL